MELRTLAERARFLPFGERGRYLRDLAERFGVTTRTIHRYLVGEVVRGEVAGYYAYFRVVPDRAPQRVTVWEPVTATHPATHPDNDRQETA